MGGAYRQFLEHVKMAGRACQNCLADWLRCKTQPVCGCYAACRNILMRRWKHPASSQLARKTSFLGTAHWGSASVECVPRLRCLPVSCTSLLSSRSSHSESSRIMTIKDSCGLGACRYNIPGNGCPRVVCASTLSPCLRASRSCSVNGDVALWCVHIVQTSVWRFHDATVQCQ